MVMDVAALAMVAALARLRCTMSSFFLNQT
jgi:hypothetical protein